MFHNLKIVVVDDEMVNTILFEELIKQEGYSQYKVFEDPVEALEYIQSEHIDAIIIDYNMPKMDGIELLEASRALYPDIVSIMITANNDEEVMSEALKSGATEFLLKPISSTVFKLRLKNILELKHALNLTKNFNNLLTEKVDEATKALRLSKFETLEVLSKAAEYKDPETASHIARVSHYSKLLARAYGLSEEEQEIIYYAAPLHDIGKIGIKDDILLKPGKLSAEEFEDMKTHTIKGGDILKDKTNSFLVAGKIIALTHHEKYNGKGYPLGLKGEDIPLYGRIVAVADVFDALTSVRPYKEAWSFERALGLLVEEKDQHFDAKLVDYFVENIDEVKKIYETFQ